MSKDEVIRFSVSLPKKLFDKLEKRVESQGYASRSEYTRDLIRDRIVQEKWSNNNEEVIGVLTMIYSHHHNNLVEKILSIQHDAKINIMCNTHIHVDHDNCLETIMLRGVSSEVKRFSDSIAALKGVKYSELTKAAIPN